MWAVWVGWALGAAVGASVTRSIKEALPTDVHWDQLADAAKCRQPKLTGTCRAALPRWHFDAVAGLCKEFSYGGCGGNGNNFLSETACREACLSARLPGPCVQASTDPNGLSGFVGTLTKTCTPRGFFELVQCHGSTGHCWCVDPLTGDKTPGTTVQPGTQPECPACHTVLAASLESRGSAGDTECDGSGLFVPMQCNSLSCWCVDFASGAVVPGTLTSKTDPEPVCVKKLQRIPVPVQNAPPPPVTIYPTPARPATIYPTPPRPQAEETSTTTQRPTEAPTTPRVTTRQAKPVPKRMGACELDAMSASPGLIGAHRPQCTPSGHYMVAQCSGSTGFCWCVDPESGVEAPESRVRGQPRCHRCHKQKARELASYLLGAALPRCDQHGHYHPIQCSPSTGYCWCVDSLTGSEVQDTISAPGDIPRCDTTPVYVVREEAADDVTTAPATTSTSKPTTKTMALGQMSGPCTERAGSGLACSLSGHFQLVQCDSADCWCADVTSGTELPETRQRRSLGQPACPVCHAAKAALYNATSPLIGAFVPQCHSSGFFEALQCHGSSGACWCVDAKTGREVPRTRRSLGEGLPECDSGALLANQLGDTPDQGLCGSTNGADCNAAGNNASQALDPLRDDVMEVSASFVAVEEPEAKPVSPYPALPTTLNSSQIQASSSTSLKASSESIPSISGLPSSGTISLSHVSFGPELEPLPDLDLLTPNMIDLDSMPSNRSIPLPSNETLSLASNGSANASEALWPLRFRMLDLATLEVSWPPPPPPSDGAEAPLIGYKLSLQGGEEKFNREIRLMRPGVAQFTVHNLVPLMAYRVTVGLLRHGPFTPDQLYARSNWTMRYFERIQCSSSECWCVDPEQGLEVLGTREAKASTGTRRSASCPECVERKADAYRTGAPPPGAFVFACSLNGSYARLQCHASTGHCWCVQPESGQEVVGSRRGPTEDVPECGRRTTRLPDPTTPIPTTIVKLATKAPAIVQDETSRDVIVREGERVRLICKASGLPEPTVSWTRLDGGVILLDGEDGLGTGRFMGSTLVLASPPVGEYNYVCDARNGVEPSALKIVTVTVLERAHNDSSTSSQRPSSESSLSSSAPSLDSVATSSLKTSESSAPWTKERTEPSPAPLEPQCRKHRETARASGLLGTFVPECDRHGRYAAVQCHVSTGHCWCVTPDTGLEVPGSRVEPGAVGRGGPLRCGECRQELADVSRGARKRPAHQPLCDKYGDYVPLQCNTQEGVCHCVTADEGRPVAGTLRALGRGPPLCRDRLQTAQNARLAEKETERELPTSAETTFVTFRETTQTSSEQTTQAKGGGVEAALLAPDHLVGPGDALEEGDGRLAPLNQLKESTTLKAVRVIRPLTNASTSDPLYQTMHEGAKHDHLYTQSKVLRPDTSTFLPTSTKIISPTKTRDFSRPQTSTSSVPLLPDGPPRARCRRPPNRGNPDCAAQPSVKYFFDSGTSECLALRHSGCGSEDGNVFASERQCSEACKYEDGTGCYAEQKDGVVGLGRGPEGTCAGDADCAQGFECKMGAFFGTCCNSSVQQLYRANYSPSCGGLSLVRLPSSLEPRFRAPLLGKTCDGFCPRGSDCRQGQLFAFCCLDGAAQDAVERPTEGPEPIRPVETFQTTAVEDPMKGVASTLASLIKMAATALSPGRTHQSGTLPPELSAEDLRVPGVEWESLERSIIVSWEAPAAFPAVKEFRISYVAASSSSTPSVVGVSGAQRSVRIGGLRPATDYRLSVTPVFASGREGRPSALVTARTAQQAQPTTAAPSSDASTTGRRGTLLGKCLLPRDPTSALLCGQTFVRRWYFDAELGRCLAFKYGQCQGNHNRFPSRRECEDSCLPQDLNVCAGNRAPFRRPGTLVDVTCGPNAPCPDDFSCRLGAFRGICCNATMERLFEASANPVCSSDAALERDEEGDALLGRKCSDDFCAGGDAECRQGPVFAFCCRPTDSAGEQDRRLRQPFSELPQNSHHSTSQMERVQHVDSLEDQQESTALPSTTAESATPSTTPLAMVTLGPEEEESSSRAKGTCTGGPEKGPCSGRRMAWYFDSFHGECLAFRFGGCGGSGLNRFSSRAECEGRCVVSPSCSGGESPLRFPSLASPVTCGVSGVGCPSESHVCRLGEFFGRCCPRATEAAYSEARRPTCDDGWAAVRAGQRALVGAKCSHDFCPHGTRCRQGPIFAFCCRSQRP